MQMNVKMELVPVSSCATIQLAPTPAVVILDILSLQISSTALVGIHIAVATSCQYIQTAETRSHFCLYIIERWSRSLFKDISFSYREFGTPIIIIIACPQSMWKIVITTYR